MAINVYCGLPGSGKSYEVVSEIIAKQFAAGRRIVTNIDGVNAEEVADYAVDKLGADPAALGSIVVVKDVDVESATFLPGEDASVSSTCRRGDIVVIDEAWRFWGTGERLLPEHLNFFRMHRHYADTVSGHTCDLVLMTQDIGDLHRALKRVVEFSARCKKHKWAGLNKRYVVNTWEGPKQTSEPAAIFQKTYDPAIFPLYKSYSGGSGKEGQLDKRQVTVNLKFKLMAATAFIGIPLFLGVAFYKAFHMGSPAHGTHPAVAGSAAATPGVGGFVTGPDGLSVPASSAVYASQLPRRRPGPQLSETWRLAGFVSLGDRRYVVLADPAGRLRDENAEAFRWAAGRPSSGVVDGERITPYSGRIPGMPAPAPPAAAVAPPAVAGALAPFAPPHPPSSVQPAAL